MFARNDVQVIGMFQRRQVLPRQLGPEPLQGKGIARRMGAPQRLGRALEIVQGWHVRFPMKAPWIR